MQLRKYYKQWSVFRFGQQSLEKLLFNAPAETSPFRLKRKWLIELLDWIQNSGRVGTEWEPISDSPVINRMAFLLWTLNRSENFRIAFVQTVRSILLRSNALDLLATTGVPNHTGILSELLERVHYKIFPQPPRHRDLSALVIQAFGRQSDVSWIGEMDAAIFSEFCAWIATPELIEHFQAQIADAILVLSIQIRSEGFDATIRERLSEKDLRKNPFFILAEEVDRFLATSDRAVSIEHLMAALENAYLALDDVYAHLSDFGVSVSIVYHLDRLEMQLTRVGILTKLLMPQEASSVVLQELLSSLVEDLARSRSLRALLGENLSLLSKKISDRSAVTGEHYITRNRHELKLFFKSAIGGGFLTGFTTLVKFSILALPLAPFLIGLSASLNYAVSFVAIQLFGFTLATKQPAMTATTLAAKMDTLSDQKGIMDLVDEIIHLFRSQLVAVVGNLIAVAPTVVLLDLLIHGVLGRHMIDGQHAKETMHSISIFGLAPAHAALTGVFLFASSQVAGWIDNWWVFRKMGIALRHHRKLQFIFGERGAAQISLFLTKNIGGMAGNISLGIFLGLFPIIFKFFGLPLDIRHVTLSTGMLAAATMSLGTSVFTSWNFYLCCLGIGAIGIANIAGAFLCSMLVALRARNVRAPQRSKIYRLFWKRIFERPSQLFWV